MQNRLNVIDSSSTRLQITGMKSPSPGKKIEINISCLCELVTCISFGGFFYKRKMDNLHIEHVLSREGGFEQFLI